MNAKRKGPKPRDEFRAFWLIHYAADGQAYTPEQKRFIHELWAVIKAWQCQQALGDAGKKLNTDHAVSG